jgi:hypothetical protein
MATMQITATTRRIQRELATTAREVEVYFDADGHAVDHHPAGMWYTDPADIPAHTYAMAGGHRTPAQVQEALDAQDLDRELGL